MAARPRLTTKQVEAALKLRERGYSWTIIGQRFGVNYMQIAQWNNIKNPDLISIGQKLTIYPAVIR